MSARLFAKCKSPAEVAEALRRAIPYRFRTWKLVQWWVIGASYGRPGQPQLALNIEYGPKPGVGPRHWNRTLSLGDVLTPDTWRREEAHQPKLRTFKGIRSVNVSAWSNNQCAVMVPVQYLPKFRQLCRLHARLSEQEERAVRDDTERVDLLEQIDLLNSRLKDREAAVRDEFRAKHIKDIARVEAAGIDRPVKV